MHVVHTDLWATHLRWKAQSRPVHAMHVVHTDLWATHLRWNAQSRPVHIPSAMHVVHIPSAMHVVHTLTAEKAPQFHILNAGDAAIDANTSGTR